MHIIKISINGDNCSSVIIRGLLELMHSNPNNKIELSINNVSIIGLFLIKQLFDNCPNVDIVHFTNNTILHAKI